MSGQGGAIDIQNILKPLEELETQLAKLYRLFHERFRDDEEAAFVFYRMSLDEKAHAGLVQYQRRLARQNPRMFEKIVFDLQDLERTAAVVDRLVEKGGALSLDRAARQSLEIEEGAAEMHLRTPAPHSDGRLARLLSTLGGADRHHVQVLKEFAVRRGFIEEEDGTP